MRTLISFCSLVPIFKLLNTWMKTVWAYNFVLPRNSLFIYSIYILFPWGNLTKARTLSSNILFSRVCVSVHRCWLSCFLPPWHALSWTWFVENQVTWKLFLILLWVKELTHQQMFINLSGSSWGWSIFFKWWGVNCQRPPVIIVCLLLPPKLQIETNEMRSYSRSEDSLLLSKFG